MTATIDAQRAPGPWQDALPPDPPDQEKATRPDDRQFVRDGCYLILRFALVHASDLPSQGEGYSRYEQSPALEIHVRKSLADAWATGLRPNPHGWMPLPGLTRRYRAPGYREPLASLPEETRGQQLERLRLHRHAYAWPEGPELERWVNRKVLAALQAYRRRHPTP
jgi:hypothetical protein